MDKHVRADPLGADLDEDQLRIVVRAVRYKWMIRKSLESSWQLLDETYSMREMSELLRKRHFVDLEILEVG
jgi:hypothetical protein